MKLYLTLSLLIVLSVSTQAQTGKCISGNCKTGHGKMLYADSSIYDGQWASGKRQGVGTLTEAERSYTGVWTAGNHTDSGLYTVLHILHSENRLYAKDIRIGRVTDDKLNGLGTLINFALCLGRMDTQMVWKGNFVEDQLSGRGSWYLPKIVTAYSDSWTDNYHFKDGRTVQVKTGEVSEGSYANGIVTPKGGTMASQSSSPPPATAPATQGAKSMLDYGIFDIHQNKLPASYSTDHK